MDEEDGLGDTHFLADFLQDKTLVVAVRGPNPVDLSLTQEHVLFTWSDIRL